MEIILHIMCCVLIVVPIAVSSKMSPMWSGILCAGLSLFIGIVSK